MFTSCQKQRSLAGSPTGKQIAEILGDEDIMHIHSATTLANKKMMNDFAEFLKASFKAMCHILHVHFTQGCPSFYTDSVVNIPDTVSQPAYIYLCIYLFIFVHSFIPDPVPYAVVFLHTKLNFTTFSRLHFPPTSIHGQPYSVLLHPSFSGSSLHSFSLWFPF